jgi:hypothetical protein
MKRIGTSPIETSSSTARTRESNGRLSCPSCAWTRTRLEAPLRGHLWLCLLFSLATVGCGTSTAPSPEHKSPDPRGPQEYWYALYLGGAKIGHGHTRLTFDRESGRDLVREQTSYDIAPTRGADVAHTTLRYDGIETIDGGLLEFTQEINLGRAPSTVTGRVEGNLLIVKSTSLGKTTIQKFDTGGPLAGPNTWERSLGPQPMPGNRTLRLRSFDPTILEVLDETITAAIPGEFDAAARPDENLHKLTRVIRRPSGAEMRFTLWVTDAGACVKVRDESDLESHRVSREKALKSAGKSLNLVTETSIKLMGDLPSGGETKRAVFRCTSANQPAANLFATDAEQSVRPIDERTVRLEVGKSTGSDEWPPTADDRQANQMIQSDDKQVISLAAKAASSVMGDEAIADALARYVHENMKNVNFTQAFASAAEVAQHLEGDCSEHAVLLCAMARARNLPARVALGLIYQPNSRTFAYHMWTEVWIASSQKGHWKPLDATVQGGVRRALYLKIAATSLKSGLADPALLQVAKVLGSRLKIEVIEAE